MRDLIGRLSIAEKGMLLTARESPLGNVSRLGLPAYDWGTNCLHGVQARCETPSMCEIFIDVCCPPPTMGLLFSYPMRVTVLYLCSLPPFFPSSFPSCFAKMRSALSHYVSFPQCVGCHLEFGCSCEHGHGDRGGTAGLVVGGGR